MQFPSPQTTDKIIKPSLFVLSLAPALWLLWLGFRDQLGANPIETITHQTGIWSLRFLCLTLLITPLRKITAWHAVIRLRRMLGLYCFFYALLHFLSYLVLDQFFDWTGITQDILKRPYISIGFLVFLMLIPLAITSTNGMIKRLGGKNWRALHQMIYVIAVGALIHFWWQERVDYSEPLIYGLLIGVLLVLRTPRFSAVIGRQ